MKLKSINKLLYRKRLNLVIVAFVIGFGFSSVGFGQVLIHFFGDTSAVPEKIQRISVNNLSQNPEIDSAVALPSQPISHVDIKNDLNEEAQKPNNFRWNLLGVILGLLLSSLTLNYLKYSVFFTEIYYVWQLKQIHNRIYRKLSKIKKLANSGNVDAYIVLNYYYLSVKSVYELDDNTLVISTVNKEIALLEQAIRDAQFHVELTMFSESLLASVEKRLPELKPI